MFLNAFILLQEYFSGLVILIAIDLLLLESIHITEDWGWCRKGAGAAACERVAPCVTKTLITIINL
jgi:hypothetical protein